MNFTDQRSPLSKVEEVQNQVDDKEPDKLPGYR